MLIRIVGQREREQQKREREKKARQENNYENH